MTVGILYLGVDVGAGDVAVNDGRVAKLITWDITGKTEYSAITSAFYQGALSSVLVFCVCSYECIIGWVG